jgi:Xaa-Pro aminopeptidase
MRVDAAYDELYQALRPGLRENECVALVNKLLYDLGSEHVEGVNAIGGERCSPHPHVYTDRALRPGDPVYFDILVAGRTDRGGQPQRGAGSCCQCP